MNIDLIDGTYELFRHFYGQRRFNKGEDKPNAAVVGVLNTVLQTIEQGATHVGVATDSESGCGERVAQSGYGERVAERRIRTKRG